MENATKALLIAAAILITILLIALGIHIFGSQSITIDSTEQLGEQMSIVGDDAIAEIGGYESTKLEDRTTILKNQWYWEYYSNKKLEYDKEYTVSFDYKVEENPTNEVIGCGIGFNNPTKGEKNYSKDIVWIVEYTNYREGAKGRFSYTFT